MVAQMLIALLNESSADFLSEMIPICRLYRSVQAQAVVLTYLTVLTISQTQTFNIQFWTKRLAHAPKLNEIVLN